METQISIRVTQCLITTVLVLRIFMAHSNEEILLYGIGAVVSCIVLMFTDDLLFLDAIFVAFIDTPILFIYVLLENNLIFRGVYVILITVHTVALNQASEEI